MTEIPDHLKHRAAEARRKAQAKADGVDFVPGDMPDCMCTSCLFKRTLDDVPHLGEDHAVPIAQSKPPKPVTAAPPLLVKFTDADGGKIYVNTIMVRSVFAKDGYIRINLRDTNWVNVRGDLDEVAARLMGVEM